MKATNSKKIHLPCLRGTMGDWMYYVTLLKFSDVANRVFLPEEIDKKYEDKENLKLGDWIQRDLENKRIKDVVNYLKTQKQRFFNSLILGMYDGKPSYREIEVVTSDSFQDEEDADYFSKTFGVLTLTGAESIFAVDGQHRAISIRKALSSDNKLGDEEICAIFVAHRTDEEGMERTRRLFSTLNRYAKPVNKKEIIALSEDDNGAILTRKIVEKYKKFDGKILISGNKSVSSSNKNTFTSIIQLYDIIILLLCSEKISGVGETVGEDRKDFTNTRISEEKLASFYTRLTLIFNQTIETFSQLDALVNKKVEVDRNDKKTNLIFRPIGQEIFFKVLKAGITFNKSTEVFKYFKDANFNLHHPVWKEVFWDNEAKTMITTTERQKYAYLLILEKIGLPFKRTPKDKVVYNSFGFSIQEI